MAADDDLPWTTTRCNRLLRPLSSKLAKLRKELEKSQSINTDPRKTATAFTTKASPYTTTGLTQPVRKPRGFDKARDPDWVPGAKPNGANKKTYGGRPGRKPGIGQCSSQNSRNTARPGEIAFTPLITRVGGGFQESPQSQNSPLRRFIKNRGPLVAKPEQFQILKRQMPSDIEKLVKGLAESYANLLQATTVGDEKRWKGTRSLMATCLRKMPAYIALEEYFAELDQEEGDDVRDVVKEVYAYLEENFESRVGQGWWHLRQILRAHGTCLLCDAFGDQVLKLESLHLLVSHCLNVAAWDEAEKLLWSYLPNVRSLSTPNNADSDLFDPQRSLYMHMIQGFVDRTGRHRLFYDVLEYMISQDLLPLEWLATKSMHQAWDRLVRTLSDGDHRTLENAFRFLETTVYAGIGLPDESIYEDGEIDVVSKQLKPSGRQEMREALDTTFSSLFTVLSSIALVNRNRDEPMGELTVHRVTWVLDSIVIGLLKRNDIRADLELLGPELENMQTFAQRALWAVCASFLVHLGGCRLDSSLALLDISSLLRSMNWVAMQYSSHGIDFSSILATIPGFISAAARSTGRIWKDDGFDQLQRLIDSLLSISGVRLPHKLWTMKRLALESATEFAHATNDADHAAYARQIEKKMHLKGRVVIMHSPEKNETPSVGGGFRWEEGIGEWVACTPFAKQDVKRLPQKPMRALDLLPTPIQSEDDQDASLISGEDGMETLLGDIDESTWDQDTTLFSDGFQHSSPVKRSHFVSRALLGKRQRAVSPLVVIPAKRIELTPPESPVIFYPTLPEDMARSSPEDKRRRSRRHSALASGLRTQRSRLSLNRSLRSIERKTYEIRELSTDSESNNDAEDSDSDISTSPEERSCYTLRARRPILSQSGTTRLAVSQVDRDESGPRTRQRPTRTTIALVRRPKRGSGQVEGKFKDEERDELLKTPGDAKRRRRSGRTRAVRRADVSFDESEDELSFQ
ncbi:hypothetical protein BS50DRAFT_572866 [Corynespora cassiicola Philippines]|uniref:Uncharacterized protein n=1 Tax=Corynespora cassiicola Philippines TaxID=1448308 RepID=A0A2T2NR37_CORCC|nr:hypothetical protein BS50DRAFT_572866 [Corynespora cassiicola Philippines]